ncbi:MAG: hypothetical protein AVDCRST_MAG49-867 [uncultured Thermomicrobiales bacterium]|uniref:Uncharacterized protein n=1 Tax=uncultured Thermomicrobiales bacterium TaxID=1645740 RepID=A0A6J4U554_9BACT|nr:MAG: hypothetical protein AVDCRST_MAG49-867 [uncultured Thermomicrobiales bacterium]
MSLTSATAALHPSPRPRPAQRVHHRGSTIVGEAPAAD